MTIWSGNIGFFVGNLLRICCECRPKATFRENDLAEVTQSLSPISRHIFVKSQWFNRCRLKIFPRFARDFMWYPLDLCCKVKESQGKVRRKSQGIHIELSGGNPDLGLDLDFSTLPAPKTTGLLTSQNSRRWTFMAGFRGEEKKGKSPPPRGATVEEKEVCVQPHTGTGISLEYIGW